MCKLNKKNDGRKIDPCIVNLIAFLNQNRIETVASCCGHGKYPITIVIKKGLFYREIVSDNIILRSKKFYKRDKQGYYFIPEVVK